MAGLMVVVVMSVGVRVVVSGAGGESWVGVDAVCGGGEARLQRPSSALLPGGGVQVGGPGVPPL